MLGAADRVGSTPAGGAACVEGAVTACSLELGEHAGVISCYEGTRVCEAGSFGPCGNGEAFELDKSRVEAAQKSASLSSLAIGGASNCLNNPCNRYCREFNEVPPAGIAPDVDSGAPPLSSWITGNLSDYPPEWVVVGNQEPCQVAGDCQFNTACTDPALGSCTHSVCAAGDPLALGCNRCADVVCAVDADCCGTSLACAHDPCEVGSGAPLERACDTCVDAVCAAHPECCDTTWNDACVGYVASECAPLGQSCGCPDGSVEDSGTCYVAGDVARDWGLARDACGVYGTGWNLIDVNGDAENAIAQNFLAASGAASAWLGGVETGIDEWTWQSSGEVFFVSDPSGGLLRPGYSYENWADSEPELGVVGRGIAIAADGEWRDAPLTFEFDYICEGPKNRLGPKQTVFGWDQGCVELAQLECGVPCSDTDQLGLGVCTARVATELDPTCAAFDLALGATCEAAGVPQIPVCNHGQAAAPAGLRLSHVPVSELGKAVPDLSAAADCVLSEPIPPGRCVSISDCPGLTPDRALVVNPVALGQDTTECRFDDNWSIYQAVPCRPAVCEADVHDATQVVADGCSIEVRNPLGIDPALARVTFGTSVPEPGCAPGETRWGASCYFFSSDVQTWDAAQSGCQSRGAGWDLVALNSPAENAWVRSQSDPLQDVQIGFNDKLTEGDHVWSNGSCRSFTNWQTSTFQPNNTPPGSEQCTRMSAAGIEEWEDKACNDGEHPFVCEGPTLAAQGGCASGQFAGPDGDCYAFIPALQGWAAARDSCQALGPGWALPSIEDEASNDFVTGLLDCTSVWLDNPPGAFSHWAPAESIDLSKDPYVDSLGFWHTTPLGVPLAALCQGPATATGAPQLSQVPNLAACTSDDQFFFSVSAVAPESLTLCPAACTLAASSPGRRIAVEIPCLPPPLPSLETVHTEIYEPDCAGGGAIWDFFYYDAVTPADSRIEFEIRTAPTLAELEANLVAFLPIASAHAIPTNTQRCDVGRPSCPIDIFTLLGNPAQQQNLLELRVRLFPGSSGEGPLLRDWKVRFSCPPSQ